VACSGIVKKADTFPRMRPRTLHDFCDTLVGSRIFFPIISILAGSCL